MRQVVQRVSGGPAEVVEVPQPVPGHAEVLVRTVSSVVSPGTERAVTELARASLLAKARARPDLVRQVVHKARTEGVAATTRALRERLAGDIPLGYSGAGVVVAAGPAASGLRPGQLVATGGAGSACHAEFQAVPRLLCTPVPQGVTAEQAAFVTIASIPLHALRLARAGPGAKVVIIGLGLVGQLAARLAMAAGCDVAGIDPGGHARRVAAGAGVLALDEKGDVTTGQVRAWSRDRGADAVLVCAATRSAAPLARAPALCRDRAAIVVVGDVGLELSRTPFYQAELSLLFARSYGPGRYEPTYERQGVDYPAGQVRWTEGRNAEAVLDLLAAGRLQVTDLVTHRFAIDEAGAAYRLLTSRPEPCLAIQLSYPPDPAPDGPVRVLAPRATGAGQRLPAHGHAGQSLGLGLIGAGSYAGRTLLPALRAAGFHRFVAVASASGLSALRTAERHGFEKAVSGAAAVTADPDVAITVVATPHASHEELTISALAAGQHVWCEKPLALSEQGVDEVEKTWRESGRQLTVGFNRRWSPAVEAARAALAGVSGPRLLVYRVAAGEVPPGHWYGDPRHGGRVVGEVCHFVDTAAAIVGCDIEEAGGLAGSGPAGGGHGEVVVSLRFTDGSLAAIAYGSATPVAGKEWVEVSAGAHRVVIDDFRSVRADGRVRWRGAQDKGQRALATAFYRAIHGGTPLPTEAMLASMRATIQAAAKARGRD